MRKVLLAILLMSSLVSLGFAGFDPDNLELRFGLGPAFWCGGDFNKGLRNENDFNQEELWGYDGKFKPLGLGYNLSAGAVYWLNPKMGLGLDLSYTRSSVGSHTVWMDYWDYERTSTLSYSASSLAIKPSFHYGFPLCDDSFLDFFFGPSFYCGCFNFDKNYIDDPYEYEHTYGFKGKASALGFHGGLGIDYKLSDRLRLFGSLNFDVTSLKNLKDDYTVEWRTPFESGSDSGTGDTLWVYDYQPNGTKYTFWEFNGIEDPPFEGGDVSNVRKGSIGGPAFGLEFGIKYKF